jgi:hypothetical protein
MGMSRKSIDTTTKDPEQVKVGLLSSARFIGRCRAITVDSDIVQPQEMVEGIRPEFGREIGATKHSANGITDGVVGTFTGTILMKGVRCSGFDSIAHLFEQVNNFRTMTKFATEIKAHVFVRNIHGKAMLGKPMVAEIDGRGFGAETFAIQCAATVINDETVASFAIEAFKVTKTVRVGRALDDNAKVDGNTLVAHSRMTGGGSAMCSTVEFGMETDGALIKFGGDRDLRNAKGIAMKIGNMARMKMARTLMPENMELVTGKVVDKVRRHIWVGDGWQSRRL